MDGNALLLLVVVVVLSFILFPNGSDRVNLWENLTERGITGRREKSKKAPTLFAPPYV